MAILQARMTSTRLPGKVMAPLLGEPMVARQLERIERASSIDRIVVATSTDASDDKLAAFLEGIGVDVVRGALDDVLGRFVQVLDAFAPEVVVRLTADCPLISPRVIDDVFRQFASSDVDYCSNTLQPTFPDGLDVEVVRAEVLRAVDAETTDRDEREHVTLGIYRQPDRFRLANHAGPEDLSGLRWTVDTPDDLAFVTRIYEMLAPEHPAFDLLDILALLARTPGLSRTTDDGIRNAALTGLDTGAMHG